MATRRDLLLNRQNTAQTAVMPQQAHGGLPPASQSSQAPAQGEEAPPPAIPPPATAPPPAQGGWGPHMPEGLDPGKVASGHTSPKYSIMQILSQFDPAGGITDQILEQLNALGIGTFSGGGDKLTVGGNVDPRFEGFTELDLIRNFTGDGSSAWTYQATNPNAPPPTQGGGNMPPLSSLSSILSSLQGGSQGGGGQAPASSADPFAAIGGGVQLPDGGWVPKSHPAAAGAIQPQAQGGGGSTSSTRPFMGDDIRSTIMELLNTGGNFNQGLLDQRTESLREELERSRGVEQQTLDAILAERGLTGGGADIRAQTDLGESLGARHATALRDLTADEGRAADSRMMQALVTGAGMTVSEAQQAIDWFNAQTGRASQQSAAHNAASDLRLREMLGLGNLGLGQAQLEASYNLGQGQLGLDREKLGLDAQQGWLQALLQALGTQAGSVPNY